MRYKLAVSLLITWVLGFASSSFAQVSLLQPSAIVSSYPWSSLTPSQQEALNTLEPDWGSLSIEQRLKWIQLSNKFERFSDADKERLKSRMSDWAKLSANDRRIARENFIKTQEIPNDKKAEAWEAYQQLTPQEKKQLSDEAASSKKGPKKPSLVNSPSLKTN